MLFPNSAKHHLYPSCNIVDLLLHLQYYQTFEPMILKMWVKSKSVLWQPVNYNLLTENKDKEIHIFEVLVFLKMYCYCQSQEILFKHHL